MRLGILGGTFDPIHLGHLYLAKKVLQDLSLDKVIFIPTYLPPHKKNVKISSDKHRYRMVKLAIADEKRFAVSNIEIKRKGRSYSVETLRRIRKRYGLSTQIFFITGSDSLKAIGKWKDLEEILGLCRFVVVKRPRHRAKKIPRNFIVLDIDAKDISATDIRVRIRKGHAVGKFLPKNVSTYIKKHEIYLNS